MPQKRFRAPANIPATAHLICAKTAFAIDGKGFLNPYSFREAASVFLSSLRQ